jgi:diguanylate cyclase (GGDEF)-like protein
MTETGGRKYTVLVVAEDQEEIGDIVQSLSGEGYQFITARNVPEALSNITYMLPNIIICEVELPDINGFELLEKIRKGFKTRLIPFIFISRSQDVYNRVHAYQTGADAFLTKPVVPDEIRAIAETKLRQLNEFYHLSVTDELTHLFNRREFLKKFNEEINSSENRVMSLALMDIDFFKRVNDAHGHQIGDNVLMTFADVLKSAGRDRYFPARFGGEEFVMLFPGMDSSQAKAEVDEIREKFAGIPFKGESGQAFYVSFSAGVAEYPVMAGNLSHLLSRADHALYSAKNEGRGRTLIYSPVMARNDRFWEHLKRRREVYLDNENRDVITGLHYLPNSLEIITGLDFEIQSIGIMVIKIDELLDYSGIRGVKNLHYDIQNIINTVIKSCENHFPSDTYFSIGSFYDFEFVVLFPSIVDFSFNIKIFNRLCREIFTEINGMVACGNFDMSFASDVIYYDRENPWGLTADIRDIASRVKSDHARRKEYGRTLRDFKRVLAGTVTTDVVFTLDCFYNAYNFHREYQFFSVRSAKYGPVTLDLLLHGLKKSGQAKVLMEKLKKAFIRKIKKPLLVPWDSRTDIMSYAVLLSELFEGKEVIIMLNESLVQDSLAESLVNITAGLPYNVHLGLDNCYIGNEVLNLLSGIDFRVICFSENITRDIHFFKERIKIINGMKLFADQVNVPVLVRNISREDELTIIRDLKIFYASGPYMEKLMKGGGMISV